MTKEKSVKILTVVINVFLVLLAVFVIGLPWIISWYVETMHRSASLAATVMVTCYPCAPFAAGALFFLKKLLKTACEMGPCSKECGDILLKIAACCIIIAFVTLIAGKFYMPFWVVSLTFTFVALLILVLKTMLAEEVK